MPYELAKLTGCTRISKSISHREDMCHQMLPAFCDVFIPSCGCCSFHTRLGLCVREYVPGFKKGLRGVLPICGAIPLARAAVRCKGGSPNDAGI